MRRSAGKPAWTRKPARTSSAPSIIPCSSSPTRARPPPPPPPPPLAPLRNGLAEAVKHGVIASPADFVWLASNVASIAREGGPADEVAERLARREHQKQAGRGARGERGRRGRKG